MKIGTVRELKKQEYRVGMTPSCVRAYVKHGHEVLVETQAGQGAGYSDSDYELAGAKTVPDAASVFEQADMIIKVKEPLEQEYALMREDQLLYTYLHLAANRELTEELLHRSVRAVAYETIELDDGSLPCLKPMSEIAGRLSVQEGAKYLEKSFGGRGVLLGGVPGVARGKVAVLGGGVVGTNACKMAVGLGAEVTVLDVNADRLEYLDDIFGGRLNTLYSTTANIERVLTESDLVVGAILLHGRKAPHLVQKRQIELMKPGAVIADVAIDQGGCFETSHPTTHESPTFEVSRVVHYCVANMPGAVPITSTQALTSVTLPYGLKIADNGLENIAKKNPAIARGVNVYCGKCVHQGVAEAFDLDYSPLQDVMEQKHAT